MQKKLHKLLREQKKPRQQDHSLTELLFLKKKAYGQIKQLPAPLPQSSQPNQVMSRNFGRTLQLPSAKLRVASFSISSSRRSPSQRSKGVMRYNSLSTKINENSSFGGEGTFDTFRLFEEENSRDSRHRHPEGSRTELHARRGIIEEITGRNQRREKIARFILKTGIQKVKQRVDQEKLLISAVDYVARRRDIGIVENDEQQESTIKHQNNEQLINCTAETQELDEYVRLLINDLGETGEFIYGVVFFPDDLYNIVPTSYTYIKEHKVSPYFTISRKGVTMYKKEEAVEFTTLEEWVKNKYQYNKLKSLKFVSRFRKFKTLKSWQQTIKKFKRAYYNRKLELKLPIMDRQLQERILQVRDACYELENIDFFALGKGSVYTLDELTSTQEYVTKFAIKHVDWFKQKVEEIILSAIFAFIDKIFKIAFSGLTKHMESGLLELGDDLNTLNFLEDGVNTASKAYRMKQIEFLRKLHRLKIPFGIKALLRDSSEKILKMPVFFDFIIISSLLKCYENNIELSREFFESCQNDNNCNMAVWRKFSQNGKNKLTPFIKINIVIAKEFEAVEIDCKEEVRVEGKEYDESAQSVGIEESQFKLFFDLIPNIRRTDIELINCDHYENRFLVEDDFSSVDVSALANYKSMMGISQPRKIIVRRVKDISNKGLKLQPSKDEVKLYYRQLFENFLETIESFSSTEKMCDFGIFHELLNIWGSSEADQDKKAGLLSPRRILGDSSFIIDFKKNYEFFIDETFINIESILPQLNKLLGQHWRNFEVSPEVFYEEPYNMSWLLSQTLSNLLATSHVMEEEIRPGIECGVVYLSTEELSHKIIEMSHKKMRDLFKGLPNYLNQRLNLIKDWVKQTHYSLSVDWNELDQYIRMKYRVKRTLSGISKVVGQLKEYQHSLNFLREYGAKISSEEWTSLSDCYNLFDELLNEVIKLDGFMMNNEGSYEAILMEDIQRNQKVLDEIYEDIIDPQKLDINLGVNDAIKSFISLRDSFEDLSEQAEAYRNYAIFLKSKPLPGYSILIQIDHSIKYRSLLWETVRNMNSKLEQWESCLTSKLDFPELDTEIKLFQKTTLLIEKNIPDNTALAYLRNKVRQYLALSPFAKALNSPYLTKAHKSELSYLFENILDPESLNYNKLNSNRITTAELLEIDTSQIHSNVLAVNVRAMHEHNLREQLTNSIEKWRKKHIPFITLESNRNVVILGNLSDFFSELEESLQVVTNILSNKYVNVIQSKAESFQKNLQDLHNAIERLNDVQTKWLFLDEIYSSSDLRRQMTSDVQVFESSVRTLLGIYKKMFSKDNALDSGQIRSVPDSIIKLEQNFVMLQNNVENFLNKKRQSYPRLYLLTNEELLILLSRSSQSPKIINKYVSKMHDAVNSLRIEDDEQGSITGILGPFGEALTFEKSLINVKMSVESFLDGATKYMKASIFREIITTYEKFTKDTKLDKNALSQLGQAVQVSYSLYWCTLMDQILREADIEELEEQLESDLENLDRLVALGRERLDMLLRSKVNNMIGCLLNFRDIAEELFDQEALSQHSFYWQNQLKYHLNKEERRIELRMHTIALPYMNEFVGSHQRLIITPITKQSWGVILLAMHSRMNVMISGPSGTGKTETIRDLARHMGQFCLVVNCSEQFSFKTIFHLFLGVVQPGIWASFNEFCRLSPDVINATSQILAEIKLNIERAVEDVQINGTKMSLDPNSVLFLTRNPGYRGRSEVPAVLKEVTRNVNIAHPNEEVIYESLLYSVGFSEGKKISYYLKLLGEYLPSQLVTQSVTLTLRFMRNVIEDASKAILEVDDGEIDETVEVTLILKSLRANIYPFLKDEDTQAFEDTIRNIFGRYIAVEDVRAELKEKTNFYLKQLGYSINNEIPDKIICLYDALLSKRGIGLIGSDQSGKGTSLGIVTQLLQTTLGMGINQRKIYPKAYPNQSLFGDLRGGEWTRGIIATCINEISSEYPQYFDIATKQIITVSDYNKILRWLVFDGKLDSMWVEDLNSALDDSMVFYMASSERVKITDKYRFIFKSDKLDKITPATISRTYFIYFNDGSYTWEDSFQVLYEEIQENSVFLKLENLDDAQFILLNLLKVFFGERPKFTFNITYSEAVKNFLHIFKVLISTAGIMTEEDESRIFHYFLSYTHYACIIGLGYIMDEESLPVFENLLHSEISRLSERRQIEPPEESDMLAYCLDIKKRRMVNTDQFLIPSIIDSSRYDDGECIVHGYFRILSPRMKLYSQALELLTKSHCDILVSGGRNSISRDIIFETMSNQASTSRLHKHSISFFPHSQSSNLEEELELGLIRKSKKLFISKSENGAKIIIDDFNLPLKDSSGVVQVYEFMRWILKEDYILDRHTYFSKQYSNCDFIGIIEKKEEVIDIPSSLIAHFVLMSMPEYSKQDLKKNYMYLLDRCIPNLLSSENPFDSPGLSKKTVDVIYEVFGKFSLEFKQTSVEPYFDIGLEKLDAIFSSFSNIREIKDKDYFVSNIIYEIDRELGDFLSTSSSQQSYSRIMQKAIKRHFPDFKWNFLEENSIQMGFIRLYESDGAENAAPRGLSIFSMQSNQIPNRNNNTTIKATNNILSNNKVAIGERLTIVVELDEFDDEIKEVIDRTRSYIHSNGMIYCNVLNHSKFKSNFARMQQAFEQESKSQNGFFLYDGALEYIAKISRVLNQPGRNLIICGPPGVGQAQITRFASYYVKLGVEELIVEAADQKTFRDNFITIVKGYYHQRKGVNLIVRLNASINTAIMQQIKYLIVYQELRGIVDNDEQLEEFLRGYSEENEVYSSKEAKMAKLKNYLRQKVHFTFMISAFTSELSSFLQKYRFVCQQSNLIFMKDWNIEAIQAIAKKHLDLLSLFFDQDRLEPSLNDWYSKTQSALVLIYKASRKVAESAKRFDRQGVYFGPYTYIRVCAEFERLYKKALGSKEEEIRRYTSGVKRVEMTSRMIDELREKVKILTPLLEEQDRIIEENLRVIEEESDVVKESQIILNQQTKEINKEKDVIKAEKFIAEKALNALNPILDESDRALDSISRNQVTELRTFSNPPPAIQVVLRAINVLLGEESDWEHTKQTLLDFKYMDRLKNLERTKVTQQELDRLKVFTTSNDFDPEVVGNQSQACRNLCVWCLAVEKFVKEYLKVKPKFEFVAQMNSRLDEKEAELKKLNLEVTSIKKKMDELETDRLQRMEKKTEIISERKLFNERIIRAEKLIAFLAVENKIWIKKIKELEESKIYMFGNVLLVSNSLHYLGPLSKPRRLELLNEWKMILQKLSIPSDDDYTLQNKIGVRSEINAWLLNGLPNRDVSIENSLLIQNVRMPTIVYDPNEEANNWLRSSFTDSAIFTRSYDIDLLPKLQTALEKGSIFVIENYAGIKTQMIEDLIRGDVFLVEGNENIQIQGINYSYNENFRLILLTRKMNTIENWESFIDFNVINFGLSEELFKENLMSAFLKRVRLDREKVKLEYLITLLKMQNSLAESRLSILKRLNRHNDYSLLDDVEFVEILENSSEDTKKTEQQIETMSEAANDDSNVRKYLNEVVDLLVCLYHSLTDLESHFGSAIISPMLYIGTLDVLLKSTELSSHEDLWNKEVQSSILSKMFQIILRGIPYDDRVFYAANLSIKTMKLRDQASPVLWKNAFQKKKMLTSKSMIETEIEKTGEDNGQVSGVWNNIKTLRLIIPNLEMDDLPKFTEAFTPKPNAEFRDTILEVLSLLPKYSPLEKLVIMKAFLPENMGMNLEIFSELTHPGILFSEPTPELLEMIQYCRAQDPLLILISQTLDITGLVQVIKTKLNRTTKVIFCANGTWDKVKETLDKSFAQGNLVFLSDINNVPSWHMKITEYISDIKANTLNPKSQDFRLIMSCPKDSEIDKELRQISLKHLLEKKEGFVQQYSRFYESIPSGRFDNPKNHGLQRLVLNLIYLCCLLIQRDSLGQYGKRKSNY